MCGCGVVIFLGLTVGIVVVFVVVVVGFPLSSSSLLLSFMVLFESVEIPIGFLWSIPVFRTAC